MPARSGSAGVDPAVAHCGAPAVDVGVGVTCVPGFGSVGFGDVVGGGALPGNGVGRGTGVCVGGGAVCGASGDVARTTLTAIPASLGHD